MNTLLVNNCPPDAGIGVYTFSLYSALRKLDKGIELFALKVPRIDQMCRKASRHFWSAPFGVVLAALTNLIFTLKIPKGYALYHISSPGLAVATRKIKPCIITVHDLIPFSFSRHDALEPLFKKSMMDLTRAQRLICVSNYTKEELMRFFNIDPGIVRVIYNGLDHEQFKPRDKVTSRRMLGLSEDKVVVLHVGSEEPRKNIPTLIKAFYKFQTEIPNALLIRVGMKTPATQRLINSLGLGDKVVYFRDGKSMGYFYNAADLFVFPSSLEGFGLPPLEAMASGCPVIASNKTSVPEVVGNAGILLDPFDVDGFAHWMHEVHTDEELKAKLIKKGFKRSKLFSWEKCARETLEVYKEILQMKP